MAGTLSCVDIARPQSIIWSYVTREASGVAESFTVAPLVAATRTGFCFISSAPR